MGRKQAVQTLLELCDESVEHVRTIEGIHAREIPGGAVQIGLTENRKHGYEFSEHRAGEYDHGVLWVGQLYPIQRKNYDPDTGRITDTVMEFHGVGIAGSPVKSEDPLETILLLLEQIKDVGSIPGAYGWTPEALWAMVVQPARDILERYPKEES